MVNWMFFPQNKKIESHLEQLISVFKDTIIIKNAYF